MLVLSLLSGGAMALGLGQIRVLSAPGQPLLAEIPIISNEPGELENARARLASPETFARVGLQPPSGLVNDLQFEITADAQGRAVVRVTSSAPVDVPALGGVMNDGARNMLNSWLLDYAREEPVYRLDDSTVGRMASRRIERVDIDPGLITIRLD